MKMRLGADGFLVPAAIEDAETVQGLRDFCPGISVEMKQPLRNSSERLYGPYLELRAAHAVDPDVRHKGSSGGALTALLCGLIKQGKVDGVLQIGMSRDDPTRSCAYYATTVEEVISNAGSRYAPASLLENLKQILDRSTRVAIVGKPCDIVAVRRFVEVFPEYGPKIYCTLSFMCMGLPSQNATDKLLQRIGVPNGADVRALRYRGFGWPGQAAAMVGEGKEYTCSYDESWGGILGRDVLFRCKICPDGWGSFADISAGDGWFTDGKEPLFDERPGRSVVFVRTERGCQVMQSCAGDIVCQDYDLSELPIIQKSQHERKNRVWIAYTILKIRGDRLLRFKGLGMWSRIFSLSPRDLYRETRGILRRIRNR